MAYIDDLRAENERLKQEVQKSNSGQPESSVPKGWERVPEDVPEKPWYKEGLVGDTISNVGNIATSAYGAGLEMATGAAKDLGQTSIAKSLQQHQKNVSGSMAEFSKDVDPTDENIIPKLIGRITPYVAAAAATKNPGFVTAGMAGLQAAGSGDPDESYMWTLAKQLTTTAGAGLINAGTGIASGAFRTLPETAQVGKQVISNPSNVLSNAGALYQGAKNKLSAMVTPNVETRAVNGLISGPVLGNSNNIWDAGEEKRKQDSYMYTPAHYIFTGDEK